MDELFAVDTSHDGILTAAKSLQQKASEPSSRPINDGIRCAQKIAKISVITLVSIGIVELLIGQISGSVVATADGIDSLSDAMISFIVFMGLVIAGRPADRKFHFGYYKVESWQNPKVTDLIRQTIEDKFRKEIKVRSILLRPAGMRVVFAAIHIEVDGSKTLADVELLTRKVEMVIHSKIHYIKKISVIPHSLPIHSEPTSILQTDVHWGS